MTKRRMVEDDFDDYFVARAPQMRRVAYLVLRDWQLAEDAVQSAFVKVYLRWARVDRSTVEAYVRRAVINESLSLVRKRGHESLPGDLPDSAETDPEPVADVIAILAELTPSQRAIVALRFVDDLPVRDVAAVMEVSEGTVKSQTARAMDSLRRRVTTPGTEETR